MSTFAASGAARFMTALIFQHHELLLQQVTVLRNASGPKLNTK